MRNRRLQPQIPTAVCRRCQSRLVSGHVLLQHGVVAPLRDDHLRIHGHDHLCRLDLCKDVPPWILPPTQLSRDEADLVQLALAVAIRGATL
jgi:hypothetical protein